jgi:hypothetical protein
MTDPGPAAVGFLRSRVVGNERLTPVAPPRTDALSQEETTRVCGVKEDVSPVELFFGLTKQADVAVGDTRHERIIALAPDAVWNSGIRARWQTTSENRGSKYRE